MSQLCAFRRRPLPHLLAAAVGLLLMVAAYDLLRPWQDNELLPAPQRHPVSPPHLPGADRWPADAHGAQPSAGDGPTEPAGRLEVRPETAVTAGREGQPSPVGAPVYSRATSVNESTLRVFQITENAAYKPNPVAALTESVGDLLASGASRLFQGVLSSSRDAPDAGGAPRPAGGRAAGAEEPPLSGPAAAANSQADRVRPPRELLVHLDLKGAPPKVAFLEQLFALVAGLGATGLLIEWEDKFPFSGELQPVAAGNAYTLPEVRAILTAARAHNLTVMPLVQTFGHLEFVLKLEPFQHLREDPATPQALCPSRNGSAALVELLLDQVMAEHAGARRVHIGSDEVFVLGRCDLCRRRARTDLLLGHVARTARYVRDRFNATPVMWEDMLRNEPASQLRAYGVDRLVEPMLWWYTPNVRRYVAPQVWRHAERVYAHVWGAGAYKGAFGAELLVAPVDRHVQNNLEWAELLADEDGRLAGGARGLVLTGWSRYDHFATLAELLPAAVPSLAFSLAAVRHGALDDAAAAAAQRALGCAPAVPLAQLQMPYMFDQMTRCRFPGQLVFLLMRRFNETAEAVRGYARDLATGHSSSWLGRYNERHGFSSVLKVRDELPKLQQQRQRAVRLLAPLHRALSGVYGPDIVLEWLEHRVLPLLEELDRLGARLEALAGRRLFAARPLRQYPDHFLRYMDQFVSGWRTRP